MLRAGARALLALDASMRIEELFEKFRVLIVDMLDIIGRKIALLRGIHRFTILT